jgi:8-oxo-dGTP diphosphatase
MTDARRFVVNAEAAVYRDGQYLLAERAAEEDHAAGALSLVGGKVEPDEGGEDVLASEAREGSSEHGSDGVLAATVRREVHEEVGVELDEVVYVTSSRFVDDGGTPVVNAVFLARHAAGEPRVREPEELADVAWLVADAALDHDDVPTFTREYLAAVDERRRALGW